VRVAQAGLTVPAVAGQLERGVRHQRSAKFARSRNCKANWGSPIRCALAGFTVDDLTEDNFLAPGSVFVLNDGIVLLNELSQR